MHQIYKVKAIKYYKRVMYNKSVNKRVFPRTCLNTKPLMRSVLNIKLINGHTLNTFPIYQMYCK